MASFPPATPAERVTANVETWRILNGTTLPFDAGAARRHVEASIARAHDFQAASLILDHTAINGRLPC